MLVPQRNTEWQVWWIDTKGDPRDVARLMRFGFVSYGAWSQGRIANIRQINRLYFRVVENEEEDVVSQTQRIFHLALERQHVLLVADEYTQVVDSPRSPGKWLGTVFRQGGGLNVGIIGQTQEPVYVPRQLLSQAAHTFLFDVYYPADIKYVRAMHEGYVRPVDLGNTHGFWHGSVDAGGPWRYYTDQRQYLAALKSKPVKRETA